MTLRQDRDRDDEFVPVVRGKGNLKDVVPSGDRRVGVGVGVGGRGDFFNSVAQGIEVGVGVGRQMA